MKNALVIALSVFLFIGIIAGGAYAFFKYSLNKVNHSLKNMHKKHKIAEEIQVTSQWLDIKLKKPLKSTKQFQKILLSIEGYDNDHLGDLEKIQLPDGTNAIPEIEITDENGKVYFLKPTSRQNDDIGFGPDKRLNDLDSLPKDVTYVSIKIRSDKPFQCKRIYWYDFDLK